MIEFAQSELWRRLGASVQGEVVVSPSPLDQQLEHHSLTMSLQLPKQEEVTQANCAKIVKVLFLVLTVFYVHKSA